MNPFSAISVLIADDDPGMRLILRKKIQLTDGFQVIGEAADGNEAMALFDRCSPQVVFLDVDMPGMTGVECARLIQDQNPACILIFATGHEEYMKEAFQVYAFDYLVKPFKMERLEKTLERIFERLTKKPEAPLRAPDAPKMHPAAGRLMLRHRDGIAFVDMGDILLVQREERATVIYALGDRRFVIPETLSEMEARLDPDLFFRCHKSYIINLQHIRSISPYGRWTYILQLDGTAHDALITHEKYEELEKRFG